MKRKIFKISPLLCTLLLTGAAVVSAQDVTGAITGIVRDPSGAAVAEASVSAKDVERGSNFPTVTNASGVFNLPRLPIGRYDLRIEANGFKSSVHPGILLQLNQTAKVDVSLEVGDLKQTVEVSSGAPLLQTEDTQLGTIIDAKTNTQLPLASRNYVQLTLLSAGAVTSNPSGFKGAQATFYSERPHINGNRQQTNNFLLDGLDNNQVSDNEVAYAPSPDAIAEFNLIAQNPSAEFGNFMGGITSVSIKSGTNSLHGSVFEFLRNNVLNANEWQNNFQGNARPVLRWNVFGGAVGGKILRDKLFFFGDYQGSRYKTPLSYNSTSLYTVAERNGDFSALTKDYGQLYNPFSLNAQGQRQPFVNNRIPLTLFSRAASQILSSKFYPTPTSSALVNNYSWTSDSHNYGDQGDGRLDWNISDKDKFFARYSQLGIDNPTVNSLPLAYNDSNTFRIYNGALDYTRSISPTLVNDARIGLNYNYNFTGKADSTLGNLPQIFGIPGVTLPFLPSMNISGGFVNGFGSSDGIQLFADTVIQYEDTAIWTKGQHNFKFGFQGYRIRLDTFYSGNNGAAGSFNFNGQYTKGPLTTANAGAADFVLGLPSSIGVGTNNGTWGQRGNTFAAFAQDTYRIKPTLTLNYGLRWEVHTPWVEVYNRMSNVTPFTGIPVLAGTNTNLYGNSRALYNPYNGIGNYQPRLGFAWTPGGGKTVLRGAYTLSSYLEGTGTNLRLTINPPFSFEKTATYTDTTQNTLPASTLDQGYTTISGGSDTYKSANLHIWDPNFRPAAAQAWNFAVQHQISSSTVLQAAYVGQKNTHLVVAQPYYQNILGPGGAIIQGPYLAGNPALRAKIGNISATETNGNQTYEGLQMTLLQRASHGLSGQLAYTLSNCKTDSTGFYGSGGGQASGQSPYVQNVYNRKAEWGDCGYDVTNYVTGYVTYDLPVGRGRKFLGNVNKLADAVVGGWQVNSIFSFHGGFPITMFIWDDPSGTGSRGPRPDCNGPVNVVGRVNEPASLGGGYQWIANPATVFTDPKSGTFGSCPVSVFRGPGAATADVSAAKRFQITERQNLEFRSEFLNLFNHPILNAPNSSCCGSTSGVVQGSQGARNVQFGLKYNF